MLVFHLLNVELEKSQWKIRISHSIKIITFFMRSLFIVKWGFKMSHVLPCYIYGFYPAMLFLLANPSFYFKGFSRLFQSGISLLLAILYFEILFTLQNFEFKI